jgi:hypothetical protein
MIVAVNIDIPHGDPDDAWRLQTAHRQWRYREWPSGQPWFDQAEAQFFFAGVNSEKTKFFHVITQLDHRYAAEVEDIFISPPERDSYTTLRTELVRLLSPSREQRIRQLPTFEMGDRKPSQFLRHLRGLVPDVPEDFLYTIWSSRLTRNIQTILAGQQECSLDAAARCADRISEVAPQPALASVGPPPNTTLLQEIEDLSRQVAALSNEQNRLRTSSREPCPSTRHPGPGPRNRRLNSRSASRGDTVHTHRWYHCRFGAKAQKCMPPCAYQKQRN